MINIDATFVFFINSINFFLKWLCCNYVLNFLLVIRKYFSKCNKGCGIYVNL